MEVHIGIPETMYLFFLITGLVVSVYESAVKSTDRIDLVACVAANVLSGCIEIVLLAWGGFFS